MHQYPAIQNHVIKHILRLPPTGSVLVEAGPDRVLVNVTEEESTIPAPEPPPAADESWANPTDGGEARNTVYTFFCILNDS